MWRTYDNLTISGSEHVPESLFFRDSSGNIVEYWQTNLVPNYYPVDEFQVHTPTDILGQHIQLVPSSDGAGSGFNHKDGTFSPDDVRMSIHPMNAQRWYLDPTVNCRHLDRTIRTVFTHDHFGQSTEQQAGLYASFSYGAERFGLEKLRDQRNSREHDCDSRKKV